MMFPSLPVLERVVPIVGITSTSHGCTCDVHRCGSGNALLLARTACCFSWLLRPPWNRMNLRLVLFSVTRVLEFKWTLFALTTINWRTNIKYINCSNLFFGLVDCRICQETALHELAVCAAAAPLPSLPAVADCCQGNYFRAAASENAAQAIRPRRKSEPSSIQTNYSNCSCTGKGGLPQLGQHKVGWWVGVTVKNLVLPKWIGGKIRGHKKW